MLEKSDTSGEANFDIHEDAGKAQLNMFERQKLTKIESFEKEVRERVLNGSLMNNFEFLDKVFDVIKRTPRHTYQILTKREKKLKEYFKYNEVPDNVWMGVSVENQKSKDRIDVLRTIDAKIRFLSLEPLLEDLGELNFKDIHWVIVGGESGYNARPMKESWAVSIQQQCDRQAIEFFFKQWGTWGEDGVKRSKKANGCLLLGKEWNGQPFPKDPRDSFGRSPSGWGEPKLHAPLFSNQG